MRDYKEFVAKIMLFSALRAVGRTKAGQNTEAGLLWTQAAPSIDIRTLQMEGKVGKHALGEVQLWLKSKDLKKNPYNLRC